MDSISRKDETEMIIGDSKFADFKTINEGIEYLMHHSEVVPELTILSGRYEERLHLKIDGIKMTGIGNVEIISGMYAKMQDDDGHDIGTFATPTAYIESRDARFSNISFVNDAGQGDIVGQAVAVFIHADNVRFEQCKFKGYQDTVCIGPLPPKQLNGQLFPEHSSRRKFEQYRVFFNQCYIEGTIDYIFGGGNAVFNQCEIKSLKRINANDVGYVTAASTDNEQKYGLTFYRCLFTSELGTNNVFLGRPWRSYACTELIDCLYDTHIVAEGWSSWEQHTPSVSTVRYSEAFSNQQQVDKLCSQRVSWAEISLRDTNLEEILNERFNDWQGV